MRFNKYRPVDGVGWNKKTSSQTTSLILASLTTRSFDLSQGGEFLNPELLLPKLKSEIYRVFITRPNRDQNEKTSRKTRESNLCKSNCPLMLNESGWPDSNWRPPAPKAGALTGLRYTPWCDFRGNDTAEGAVCQGKSMGDW